MAWCRRDPEGLKLHFDANEVGLFHFLCRELKRLLEHGDFDQPAMTGFSPSLQRAEDPRAEAGELDEAMDQELMLYRLARVEEVRKELLEAAPDGEVPEEGLVLTLDMARADVWLAWLTDLRLLLGAVLGLSPETPESIDWDDPASWTMEERMYLFLSELQEMMLSKMGGGA